MFVTVVVLGAAAVTLTRSPFFARSHDRGARCLARGRPRGVAHRGRRPATRTSSRWTRAPPSAGSSGTRGSRTRRSRRTALDARDRRPRAHRGAVAESDGVLRLVADDGAFLDAARPRDAVGMPSIVTATRTGWRRRSRPSGERRARSPRWRRRSAGASTASRSWRTDSSGSICPSGPSAAYGEAVELQEKAMALRALAGLRGGAWGDRRLRRRAGAVGPDRGARRCGEVVTP